MKNIKAKTLKEKVSEATIGIRCPIHLKEPKITLKGEPVIAEIDCCCSSFKTDISVVVARVLRTWNLHGEHLRARKKDERR